MADYTEYSKSRELANVSLDIRGIALDAVKPFNWASGYNMPIYNDNRMLLGLFENRMLVTEGFLEIIKNNKIEFDYIQGTSTAGIAPAASLARKFNKPLIIIDNGQAYSLDYYFDYNSERNKEFKSADVIAATVPWAIQEGITTANLLQKPFIYIRPAKKDHGKQKQIEGILYPEQTVALINLFKGKENDYLLSAWDAIKEAEGELKYTWSVDLDTIKFDHNTQGLQPKDIRGKKVLVIEDLISYGGSSAKEVASARNLGATVTDLISIFTYNLEDAKKQFSQLDSVCKTHSILPYEILLEEAIKTGYITKNDEALLKEWRLDPNNWGVKHGFPKIEKK